MGESYTKDAYKSIYKHPKWKGEAQHYEEHLAATLFHNTYTKNAVKTALGKISRILTAYYGDGEKTLDRQQTQTIEAASAITDLAESTGNGTGDIAINKTLVKALMQERRDASSVGQVMKVTTEDASSEEPSRNYTEDEADQRNMQTLDAVINGDGNLREQMTLLYNGMFINGGRSSEQIRTGTSLKGLFMGITRDRAAQSGSEDLQGIDFDLLEGQANYRDGKDVLDTYHLARDLEKRNEEKQGKGNVISRWWRGVKRAFSAAIGNSFKRNKRTTALREGEVGMGLQHYDSLGIGLSDREKALSVVRQGPNQEEKLLWKEGAAYYMPKEEVTAEGLLQTAGVSGTTLRMLGAYRLMGATQKELLDFRLALIAWMVSSHDHSLYEIMRGSHNAGVKGSENIEEAATMYTNIDPLDAILLREHFTENQEFPHEIVYKEMLNELFQARIEREKEVGTYEDLNEMRTSYEELEARILRAQQEYQEKEAKLADLREEIERLREMQIQFQYGTYELDAEGTMQFQVEERLSELRDMIPEIEASLITLQNEYDAAVSEKKGMAKPQYPTLYRNSESGRIFGLDAMAMKAQELALNIYSTSAYKSMNTGQKYGSLIARGKLKNDEGYQGAKKDEYSSGKLVDRIYEMVRLSARMTQDALEERGSNKAEDAASDYRPSYEWTYRGEKNSGSGYRMIGQTYETPSVTSTSKSLEQALLFYSKQLKEVGPDKSVLAIYKMEGKGSVDITEISTYRDEEEVLVPKGSTFRVEKALMKNVKVADIQDNVENYQSDNITEEDVKQEVQAFRRFGITPAHVNVVRLIEVDGPGKRRRRAEKASRDARNSIRQSFGA